MAFSPSFSIAQTSLDCSLIIATDTSVGSDGAIVGRRITFTTTSGTTLVVSGTNTSYNTWALANVTQSFSVLPSDYALSILVQWVNVSGNVLYSSTQSYCLAYYNKQFMYYLVQLQSLTPGIYQDTNYSSNLATFWTTIVGAVNAVIIGNDLAASQNMLNKGTYMRQNQDKFF